MALNIFDGPKIRPLTSAADLSAIEALPDDHRETLFACIDACKARDEADARVNSTRLEVYAKQTALSEAVKAHEHAPPLLDPLTGAEIKQGPRAEPAISSDSKHAQRVAAARAVSLAQRPDYVPAEPVKNEAQDTMDAASAELAEKQAAFARASKEYRMLETAAGEAINAWRKCLPVMTRDELMKEHVARGQADRMARVARGESPEPPRVVPEYQSELDRVRGVAKLKPRPLMR